MVVRQSNREVEGVENREEKDAKGQAVACRVVLCPHYFMAAASWAKYAAESCR
jgi:hypothetical protein